jgi:hypothetical protein
VGNKELLHTTQFQAALYMASGKRREMGVLFSPLRGFEGNEISVVQLKGFAPV